MFSNFFLRSFRILLLPFALLYWLVISIRNWCYNRKIFSTTRFGLPLIGIGNLAVGGTGKSPMVEYLIELLQPAFKVATLSRGYKRKTKGYALAAPGTTALEIGDEPMQFHRKYPQIPVAVGEQRILAIPQLLHDRPETQVIILDDVLQHRAIDPGLKILLTDYNNLFTRDFYLPTGDLRDLKSSYRRADILIVTKCRPDLDVAEKTRIVAEIKPLSHQKQYFTTIRYGIPYHISGGEKKNILPETEVLLVSGIANPRPLQQYLEQQSESYQLMQYADHHIFTIDDLREISARFSKMNAADKLILTTEKDAVRLMKFRSEIEELPFYVMPIRHEFLFDEGRLFDAEVTAFITNFKTQD